MILEESVRNEARLIYADKKCWAKAFSRYLTAAAKLGARNSMRWVLVVEQSKKTHGHTAQMLAAAGTLLTANAPGGAKAAKARAARRDAVVVEGGCTQPRADTGAAMQMPAFVSASSVDAWPVAGLERWGGNSADPLLWPPAPVMQKCTRKMKYRHRTHADITEY